MILFLKYLSCVFFINSKTEFSCFSMSWILDLMCFADVNLYAKKEDNIKIKNVNDEIKSTLIKSPDKFWYYNNGITIVASKIEKSMVGGTTRDIGSFKLTGASIVNGAQTVSTIGAYLQEGGIGLEKVKVQVRIISLSDTPQSFGAEVTIMHVTPMGKSGTVPEQLKKAVSMEYGGLKYQVKIMQSPNPVAEILKESMEYDLVVIGTSESSVFQRILFGSKPRQIAENCSCSVMMVRKNTGIRSWFKRWFV